MTVSMCLMKALDISTAPRQRWKSAIEQLPAQCQHPDVCGGGIGCRQRIADYLRVQYQAQALREQKQGGRAR